MTARRGSRPARPFGTSSGYDDRASPLLFAEGALTRFTPAPGSAALMSLIWFRLNEVPSTRSGPVTADSASGIVATALRSNSGERRPVMVSTMARMTVTPVRPRTADG
ncbi:hypothetical protein EAO70_05205 [Streptomyces sp. adm13(2018)]|nr:hypothetical protein EAO70_05205 [Streptomyces sp. adm13(2018)]